LFWAVSQPLFVSHLLRFVQHCTSIRSPLLCSLPLRRRPKQQAGSSDRSATTRRQCLWQPQVLLPNMPQKARAVPTSAAHEAYPNCLRIADAIEDVASAAGVCSQNPHALSSQTWVFFFPSSSQTWVCFFPAKKPPLGSRWTFTDFAQHSQQYHANRYIKAIPHKVLPQ